MNYTLSEVYAITGGTFHGQEDNRRLSVPAFDSRRIAEPENTLFFALSGVSRSGADFVKSAWEKGVRHFVVPKGFDTQGYAAGCFIEHENVLQALQTLATAHRNKFTGPVIGITGSNGKTIVKEWLFQLLGSEFQAYRSPRSYNSQVGVAVSLLGIESWHKMAIIEAGISQPGEMEKLHAMIRPSLAICTHLGSAHDEGFADKQLKATEKARIFYGADVVVYPYDSAEMRAAVGSLRASQPMTKFISWGREEGSSYRIAKESLHAGSTEIQFVYRGSTHAIRIPFADKASVDNAMTCLCTLAAFERWDEQHITAFASLEPLENRMSFTEGKNGNYLVNDSYSNDPDSLEVALDFLIRQQPDMPHTVILSDLDQSDPDKNRLYQRVADLLRAKGTETLLGVGNGLSGHAHLFDGIACFFFPDTASLLSSGAVQSLHKQAVLIKGSRRFMFEQVYDVLKKQLHKTWLRIDLDNLRFNYSLFKNRLSGKTKIMAMVKAFGYGSGSFEAARTLQFLGADYLAVAYADEGVALREAGIKTPIMVMNSPVADIAANVGHSLEPVIFNVAGLESCMLLPAGSRIHLELDTGMHRLGFDLSDAVSALDKLPSHIIVASVFSHLVASEDAAHDEFTRLQIDKFKTVAAAIEQRLGYTVLKHILNTGGILRFPEAAMDMVRLGIGLYGVDPSADNESGLKPVTSLLTTISQLREVEAGESIGYGRRAVSDRNRIIATLPVGYADGLRRALGNEQGSVWINGQVAPLVGSICMDMCMADVTGLDCTVGSTVEIFGNHIPVAQIAAACETIPYEILTGISPRVPRVYVGEN
jgi:alanine racemase